MQVFTSTRLNAVRIMAFAMAICILTGCQKSNNHHPKTVPLKGQFTTVTTILQTGPPELDSIAGQGSGTPIGKSSFIAHAKFDENYNLSGVIVTTADNSDKILATITGHAPDIEDAGNITLHFDAIISGGTGKYAGATGKFLGTAHENLYNADGSAEWDGTITY